MFLGLFETSVGGKDSGIKTEDGRPLFWVQVLKAGTVPDRDVEITTDHIKSAAAQYIKHLETNPQNFRRFDYLHNGAKRVQSIEDRIASGWIHALETREDDQELWALVDWTDKAKQKIADREFRYVSSEIVFQGKEKAQLVGATLTNDPAILALNGLFEDKTKMAKEEFYQEGKEMDMKDKKEEMAHEEGHASKDEVIELRKLRDLLGLAPEMSVLDVLKHIEALAKKQIEMESTAANKVILERSDFEQFQAFKVELESMRAEQAFETALKAHRILPAKKDVFIKLYKQDQELAEALLYEAGKFEDLISSVGITGEASPTYTSEGLPSVEEFGAASEELATWFESGKSESDFEASNPAAYNVYKRGMTLGIKRG